MVQSVWVQKTALQTSCPQSRSILEPSVILPWVVPTKSAFSLSLVM